MQQNQPDGVPPLELTGERTLPDVPEENYWYRRHLAVYEWIAERCAGLRVADLACGEGYGSDVLAGAAAEVVGVDANPEAHEHAAAALPARRTCASSAALVEEFAEPVRRDRLPADDRARRRARQRCSSGFAAAAPVAYVSTPNRLTLRRPGRREVRQPLAPARVHGRASTASCSSPTSRGSRSSASSTPASCAPTSWR